MCELELGSFEPNHFLTLHCGIYFRPLCPGRDRRTDERPRIRVGPRHGGVREVGSCQWYRKLVDLCADIVWD